MRLRLTLLGCLLVCASAALAAPSWRFYANDRFGVTADVPADWREQPPPENDDGRLFLSPDGTASLAVNGGYVMEDSAAMALAARAEPFKGERITYAQRGARTVTVSGFVGDRIFYRHSLLSCGAQVWSNVELEYPADEKAALDPIVAHVVASLHSGVPAGMSCKECGAPCKD
jgi:hypothetical protein